MKCVVCGKEMLKSTYSNKDLCSSECFRVDYWNEKVEVKDNIHVARIEGEHYYIGDENQRGRKDERGFGGRKFVIQFNDGRKITTTNLWHNGTIPDSHKELLPDNAIFVKE